MPESPENTLRALIRLLPPARALKEDLEKSIHLELFAGTGDAAVKTFQGLQASVARIVDDPYIKMLTLEVPEGVGDREKIALARLAAGQLLAYLEGQTGLPASTGDTHIQTAPNITIGNLSGMPQEGMENMMEMISKALKEKPGEEQPEV